MKSFKQNTFSNIITLKPSRYLECMLTLLNITSIEWRRVMLQINKFMLDIYVKHMAVMISSTTSKDLTA